jgi:transcriptional regulator with XRE-family HTH domain
MKTTTINQEIGNRIKLARISMNLSQDSVAEDLGISVSAYSNMERGAVDITVVRVVDVAKILKTNWLGLLGVSQSHNLQNLNPTSSSNLEFISLNNYLELIKEIDLIKLELRKFKSSKNK